MKDLIIVGAGGFGRELLQWCKDINKQKPTWNIRGFIDDNPNALNGYECDYSVIGSIKDWCPSDNEEFALAVAEPHLKEKIVRILKTRKAVFATIIHPTARICDFSKIGEGLVLYPYSGINVNTKIGNFVTLLSSGIGHDCEVGDFCTISSYCDITGGVKLGKRVFIGSRSTVVPKRKIEDDVYIATGSIVVTNLKSGVRVMGNPAVKMDF